MCLARFINIKMRKCYKYRGGIGVFDKDGKSIFEREVSALANNQIYLPTKSELNDPTEGFCNDCKIILLIEAFKQFSGKVKKQYQGLLEKFAQIEVYSLSKNVTNELLWAYYGGGHTGFAIEYDIGTLKESLNYIGIFKLFLMSMLIIPEKFLLRICPYFMGKKILIKL